MVAPAGDQAISDLPWASSIRLLTVAVGAQQAEIVCSLVPRKESDLVLIGKPARQDVRRSCPEERVIAGLHHAGLDAVLARAGGLDSEHDWPAILSLGEQQLLALARRILARPAFAMLDRVGAALKPALVLQALRCLGESSITYITLAEDAESASLYDAVLEIDAEGVWSWRRMDRDPRGDGGRAAASQADVQ
jgi:ABC-type uncharacterized transport system fused permease/ATPase subunit